MKSILVVDDMAVFREPIAASLRLAGYQTFCAADGEEALLTARAHHPDLILLDVSMPKMDGITFLKHLRDDPAIANTRVILLTALAEKKYIIAAATLGVKDYLLKSRFRLADLLDRIKKSDAPTAPTTPTAPKAPTKGSAEPTAASKPQPVAGKMPSAKSGCEVPRLLTRQQFLQRVETAFQAKTLSGVVAQVISMAGSQFADMSELAALIARDPLLAARVLRVANSASYASTKSVVTNVPDAVRKIGWCTVRNIAAAVGVFDCMPDASPDGFNPIRHWQHSFAVAQLSECLAQAELAHQAGLAYIVGLCHDLGDIFIRMQFSAEYQQVTEVAARTGRAPEDLYAEMLGVTPALMVKAILKTMSLPDAIREPIETFHSPGVARATDRLTRVLWLAENYANAVTLASSPASKVRPITRPFCRATIGDQDPVLPDPQSLRSEIVGLTLTLSRLSPAEEAKLMAPMFPTEPSRVWVARHPAMCAFDPVGTALRAMTEPAIHERLPTEVELATIDGLVVVAPSCNAAEFTVQDIERRTVAVRGSSRSISVLALSPVGGSEGGQSAGLRFQDSVTLSELASFLKRLSLDAKSAAAA